MLRLGAHWYLDLRLVAVLVLVVVVLGCWLRLCPKRRRKRQQYVGTGKLAQLDRQ